MKEEILTMLNSENREDVLLGVRIMMQTMSRGEVYWWFKNNPSKDWTTHEHLMSGLVREYGKTFDGANEAIFMKNYIILLDEFGMEYISEKKWDKGLYDVYKTENKIINL